MNLQCKKQKLVLAFFKNQLYYIDAERRDAPLIPVLSALKGGK
jgi:hypothetical protein